MKTQWIGVIACLATLTCVSSAQRLRWLPLPANATHGKSVAVDDFSDYIVGSITINNAEYACYWRGVSSTLNGPFTILDAPSTARSVNTTNLIVGDTLRRPTKGFYYNGSVTFLNNLFGSYDVTARDTAAIDEIVVGGSANASGVTFPVYWFMGVANLLWNEPGVANGISPDGEVIVGVINGRAVYWRELTPTYIAPNPSEAKDASREGSVIVGNQRIGSFWEGFVFENGTRKSLPKLSGHLNGRATAVDASGIRVVGSSTDPLGNSVGVLWERLPNAQWAIRKLRDLCTAGLSSGDLLITAHGISNSGRYIVGVGYRASTNRYEPFIIDMNPCPVVPGDVDINGTVDDADMLTVLFAFGSAGDPDLNGDGQVDDSDLLIVLFNFGQQEQCTDCCQAEWLVYNTIAGVQRIELEPNTPADIQDAYVDDPDDDWQVRRDATGKYIISHASGTLPTLADEMQDEVFYIRLRQHTTFTARWYDTSGTLIKEEQLHSPCYPTSTLNEENESQWEINRTHIQGVSDDVAFSGFVPDSCDVEEHDIDSRVSAAAFSWDISCSGGSSLTLNLSVDSPQSGANYTWEIQYDGNSPLALDGNSVSASIPSNTRKIVIKLNEKVVTDSGATEQNSVTKTICLPTADFEVSPAVAVCNASGTITGYKVKVKPVGLCLSSGSVEVVTPDHYRWSFGTANQNGTGNPSETEYTFPPTIAGSQEVRLSIDIGGCTRSVSKTVTILRPCEPRFRVKYTLCNTTCQNSGDIVPITFVCENLNRNDCTTYEWSFGGGAWVQNNAATVTHTHNFDKYQIWNQDCSPRNYQYTIRLKAANAECPSGEVREIVVTIRPMNGAITVNVCPDGKTQFCANGSAKVQWRNGGNLPSGWDEQVQQLLPTQTCFTYNLPTGRYTVIGKFTEQQDLDPTLEGPEIVVECEQAHTFDVQVRCCEVFKAKGHEDFVHNNKNYRIYYKHKVRLKNIPRISAKTKLKRERKRRLIRYYTNAKADEISLLTNSTLRSKDNMGTVECNCMIPKPIYKPNSLVNRSKIKLKELLPSTLGIHQDDALCCIHRVKIGGTEIFVRTLKPQGSFCDGGSVTRDSSCP